MPDTPHIVAFDPDRVRDLRSRLAATRWSDAVTDDWRDGADGHLLRTLVEHWQTAYDVRAAERRLNALPQFRATIDGFGVHYLLLKGRGPNRAPLLLINGWPSSFVEYRHLAPMLPIPTRMGVRPRTPSTSSCPPIRASASPTGRRGSARSGPSISSTV